MDSRDRFEAWLKSVGNYSSSDFEMEDWDNQPYVSGDIQNDWEAWQACESSRRVNHTDICIALRELHCSSDDTEAAHAMADKLLCDMLERLGYNEVVDAYKIIDKWYA